MACFTRRRVWLFICLQAACTLTAACNDPSASQHVTAQSGTASMQLKGKSQSGREYRLRNATFDVTGPTTAVLNSEDDPDAQSIDVELAPGSYTVQLQSGFFIERAEPDGTFKRVEWQILSANPQSFEIVDRRTTKVRYRFRIYGEVIELGGTLSIDVEFDDAEDDGSPVSSLDMVHRSDSSTVFTRRRDVSPEPGERIFTLPPLSENVWLTADGATLNHEIIYEPDSPDTLVRTRIPSGTRVLHLSYDVLDGSLPYDGLWYLRHPTAVGARQVRIELPPGAVINRLDWPDTDPDPSRIAFQTTEGREEPFVVYSTPEVPDLYDHIDTPHFTVNVAQAHRRYQPAILGLLENLYALYGQYTGQDVNEIQGQPRYSYSFPPAHWRWAGVYEIGGGLSVKGTSAVNGSLVPQIGLPTTNGYNTMVAVTAHELGNGWWGTWEEPDPDNSTPRWIDNEGHSGFLRSQGELDLGYCADARRENASHYQDFANCTSECGGETVLVSLQDRFGWEPFRAFYAAVQNREFNFRGMSEVERSSLIIRFFSEQAQANLVPFFDAAHISMTQAVRDELSNRFSVVDVPILDDLSCRPNRLRVVPNPVHADVPDGAQSADVTAFACAPGGWNAWVSPTPSLSVLAPSTNNCGTATVTANVAETGFGEIGQITVTGFFVADSPQTAPITLTPLHNLLSDGDFEQPFDTSWIRVAYLPSGKFELDTQTRHAGNGALRIDAPEENDVRLVQSIAVKPNTQYKLSGWVRSENVERGLGATLSVEWPGSGWATSRALTGTTDWTFVTLYVNSGTSTSFEVQARLGHYGSTSVGRAWFDDLRLEELP